MKRVLVSFLVSILMTACMSMPKFQRPYSQLYVPLEDVKALKKVLLVGPLFAGMGINDEAWLQKTGDMWQRDILSKWSTFRGNDSQLYELKSSNQAHYKLLADLFAEQKLDEIPIYDTKTGQMNSERDTRIKAAYGKLAQKEGFDAVLHVDFVVVPVEVKYNVASWDGQFENITHLSGGGWATALLFKTYPGYAEGKAPGLSIVSKLIDRNGQVLCEGRGGYKILTEVKAGAFGSTDQATLSFNEAFDEKYRRHRDLAITWALMAVAAPKKSGGE